MKNIVILMIAIIKDIFLMILLMFFDDIFDNILFVDLV